MPSHVLTECHTPSLVIHLESSARRSKRNDPVLTDYYYNPSQMNICEGQEILAMQVGNSVDQKFLVSGKQHMDTNYSKPAGNVKAKGNDASRSETLIPMGESMIDMHDEHMSDF